MFLERIIVEKDYLREILKNLNYNSKIKNISIELINKTVNEIEDEGSANIRRSIRNSIKFSFRNR